MLLLKVILVFQLFSENWRYLRSQVQPEFNEACRNDNGCNRFQVESEFQCSVCAEDKSGKGRCLNTFIDKEWFNDQCRIPDKCELPCYSGGRCEQRGDAYSQACFCPERQYGPNCTIKARPGFIGLRMLQWHRENIFSKPGEKTRFYYRSIADTNVIKSGLYRVFMTDFGHTHNVGEHGKTGMSSPSACMDKVGVKDELMLKEMHLNQSDSESFYRLSEHLNISYRRHLKYKMNFTGILCTDDYTDLQFPFLLPNNRFGVTVLKMKDKLKGYLTSVTGKFIADRMNMYIGYTYKVFVSYERVSFLKCIPLIRLTNCARSYGESSNFSFRRNEYVAINYNVKFLENGAYLSTAKENKQACTAEDTTWTWTWSRYYVKHGIETQGEEGTEIGTFFKFLPFTLEFGTYRVTLTIKRVVYAATNENFDECFFKVKPWPLHADIDGGEVRRVIKDKGVTLAATQSYDPNQPSNKQDSLKVLWTCECLTKEIPNCEQTCMFNKKEPYRWMNVYQGFYVRPNQLQYNAAYKFTVMVDSTIKYPSKDVAPQYSHIIVKVGNESETVAINYFIECIQNCRRENTMPSEILFLKAQVYGNGGSSQKVDANIVFDWSYSKENDSTPHPVDSIKLSGPPTSILAIKEGSFQQGISYTILLAERNGSEYLAKYSFMTKLVKYEGNCRVDPPSGTKGLSIFNIICDGLDGYIFEFYDNNENDLQEKAVFTGRMLGTSEFLGSLEDVRITRGTIVVYVIYKDSGDYSTIVIKVELSPWNINENIMEEIKKNLTSTVRLGGLSTTMTYVSFIVDVLPEWVDKSEMLQELLESINKVGLNTVADAKLSSSTLKTVLQTLNKPKPLALDLGLIKRTLVTIKSQANIIEHAATIRDVSEWMSSHEIRHVATTILECLNAAITSEDASTVGLSEEHTSFDTLIVLKKMAGEKEMIVERVKDILSYIQAPGLPPAKLASSDNSFQVWAMGDDDDYPVTRMLWNDRTIPFGVPKYLLKAYSRKKHFEERLFFQAAVIEKNVFSWSQSAVKSKLVSLSVTVNEKGKMMEKLRRLPSPIYVRIDMDKNLTNTTVEGSTLQLDPDLNPEDWDLGVTVHRIDILPKSFIRISFLFPPTNTSLRVLVMDDFRPDYELMTKGSIIINASHPEYPLRHRPVDTQAFLYMGILPEINVPVNKTVPYEFQVSVTLCQLWIESQWSDMGCAVSLSSTPTQTVCACDHLSIFAAAFPVPPQSIDPIGDAKLFLTVLDNPLVVVFVIILFIIYLLLMLWGRKKDNSDKYKGSVVVLDDNFPEDPYPYLVAVHTSSRFNAGTTAHVGIQLIGKEATSRAHILSSASRKVLKRNTDDWFMIYTSKPLGDVYEIQIWHDNFGSRPEWFCDKIIVYDISNGNEYLFIVEQWLALRTGDFPEAILVIASDQEVLNIKRMFLDNAVLGLRDSHTFLSIFVRHPRSDVTRVQRVSIMMCFIIVAMLCSIMFYLPPDPSNSTDDYHYTIRTRDLLISIQTAIITAVLTMVVLLTFRKSYRVTYKRRRTTVRYRRDEFSESMTQDSRAPQTHNQDKSKSFYDNYVHYVSKYLKNPPLTPVHLWEGEKMVQKRKIWYIIAWSSCISIILGAAYLVMLYGLKLGKVQSQKWLTSLVMSMGEDIFLISPGKIIVAAILLSVAFQMSTKVNVHGIDLKDLVTARPEGDLAYMAQLVAKRNHPMYLPLSSPARMALLEKKIIRKKWWSLVDFTNVVCYVIVLSSVISRLWTSHYHGSEHLKCMFSKTDKEEYGSVDIENINNISMVESYFEVTFFEVLFNLRWYNGEPLTTLVAESDGIRRYWAKDGLNKIIGKLHIRQVRVVPHECSNVYFKKMKMCLLEWSLQEKDKNIYGEHWTPATYVDTYKKDSPWQYRNSSRTLWWTNQRFYGVYGTLYDVSGFYTSVGPTLKAAQKVFDELQENEWQDWYTRACFLTGTVYNVNDKVFSQVTILFEYFVHGSMFTTITIIPVSRDVLFGVWELLLVLYSVYYVFRSGYLVNRMGLMDYLKAITNMTRVINVLLSFLAIIIWCVHHLTSIKYAEDYMKRGQDDYFEFDKFRGTFSFLQVVLSLLLCITIGRTFLLLQGGRRFLNIYYTLIISITWLCWLSVGLILMIFVLKTLQYFLYCETFFRVKELVIPQGMTVNLQNASLEQGNLQVFILLRAATMFFIRTLFIILFMFYARIAKVYKLKDSDSFNFVSFAVERMKKCCTRKKKNK